MKHIVAAVALLASVGLGIWILRQAWLAIKEDEEQ